MTISKQPTGFKFGQHRLSVIDTHGQVELRGRTYKLVTVQTADGLVYRSLRLYNGRHFIKQLLFEPEVASAIGDLISGLKVLHG